MPSFAALALLTSTIAASPPPDPPQTATATPTSAIAEAPPADWKRIRAEDLLVLDLARGGRVVIQLSDAFAPVHVANIRALARAHWYDGLVIERVQDNYVVQWGDPDSAKPLPAGVIRVSPAEYDRPAAGLALTVLPYRDTYAERVGVVDGLPAAEADGRAWPVHCYGMVGVGRDLSPDTGSGAELYAVIGHSPRALDRNIALAGRVLAGMDLLAALPRGQGKLGFYTDPAQRLRIDRVRLASDLPAAERPAYERLREDSAGYRAWVQVKANRQDDFFVHPAGALDICNAVPPVRSAPR